MSRKIILAADRRVKLGHGHPIGKYTEIVTGDFGAVILTPENAYKGTLYPEFCQRVYATSLAELRAKIAEIYSA